MLQLSSSLDHAQLQRSKIEGLYNYMYVFVLMYMYNVYSCDMCVDQY